MAKPTVPSVASISTKNEPNTLMPQLVRDFRYSSHLEQGVEIGESINLVSVSFSLGSSLEARPQHVRTYQWPLLTLW